MRRAATTLRRVGAGLAAAALALVLWLAFAAWLQPRHALDWLAGLALCG